MLESRSSRRFTAGLGLAALAAASVLVLRGTAPAYQPSAPSYRQKGPADAPVTLVEFSDFQCPGCRAAVEPVERLRKLFEGRLRVVFKHRPWPFHRWAKDAAAASECAGRAGRFWQYHDALFADQERWSRSEKAPELFARYAKAAGLDVPAFEACLRGEDAKAEVERDLKDASDRWVNSTPTFFINGRRFVGSRQLGSLGLNHVEDILKENR